MTSNGNDGVLVGLKAPLLHFRLPWCMLDNLLPFLQFASTYMASTDTLFLVYSLQHQDGFHESV